MAEENTVLVGNKPAMSYVLAVVTQFHNGADDVHVKARGRAISRAVDVAEIVKNKFMTDLKVKKISISTDNLKGDQGESVNVSAIDIALNK
jgi:DNA-binding protein